MEKFKISNASAEAATVIMLMCFTLPLFVGILFLSDSTDPKVCIIPACISFVGIFVGFLILVGMRTWVDYDGIVIRLKSFFEKKEIDLSKIEKVSYEYVKGRGRRAGHSMDVVRLDFIPDKTTAEDWRTLSLYDSVSYEVVDSIMKGEYSSFPLMRMYQDIIARYPEKKA